jgi:hypothetical protein
MHQPASSPHTRDLAFGIFFISLASLALEITLTRILSVITWYYLAYFAVSLAMLGMTAGAVAVYLNKAWSDPARFERRLAVNAIAFAWITPVALLLLCWIPLRSPSIDLLSHISPLSSLLLVSASCALPFYFSGVAVTAVLTRSAAPVSKLYGADLVGAAVACLFVLSGLNLMDAPSLVLACAAFGGIAAFFFCRTTGPTILRAASLASFLLVLAASVVNALRPEIRPRFVKDQYENPRTYALEKWNTLSKVGVTNVLTDIPQYWGKSPKAPLTPVRQRWLNIDGNAGTNLRQFSRLEDIEHLRYDVTSAAYYIAPPGRAGIIGVGGAKDIQCAIVFHHSPVIGIDVNPIFIQLLRRQFADFGGVAARKDVILVVDEGRSYFSRSEDHFSIIQMALVDTWAATGAGAFTLSENALYTTDAWKIFYQRLADGGILTVSRWFNPNDPSETGRILSLAVATLLDVGVKQPRQHIALISVENIATLLLSRSPLDAKQIARLRQVTRELEFQPIIMPDEISPVPLLARIAGARSREELESVAAQSPLNISPPGDEKPYFFNMLRLKHIGYVMKHGMGIASGNLVATVFLAGLIAVLLLLLLAVVLLPLILKYRGSLASVVRSPGFVPGALYFSLIGAGFMFIEIGVMQRMSIFLGHPVYALVVLLLTITLSSGCGSLASDYLPKTRRLFFCYPIVIGAGILLFRLILNYLHAFAIGYPQSLKVLITIASLFPLGMAMGMCFPLGMYLVRRHQDTQTPWYWGLNGIFSVLASTLAIFTSIYFGISTTFYLAAGCYLSLLACNVKLVKGSYEGL